MRLLIICTCAAAIGTSCCMTRTQAEATARAAGNAGSFFGLPAPIGEAGALALMTLFGVIGHKNGRRCERRAVARPPTLKASP